MFVKNGYLLLSVLGIFPTIFGRHTAVQGKVAPQKESSTTTIPFISFSGHDPAIRVAFNAVRIFLSLHGHCNAFVSRREDMPSFVAG